MPMPPTVTLPGPTAAVVACHCRYCQKRTGSPFGVMAYYPSEQLILSGDAKNYERPTDEGNHFTTYFCPYCGSTVYAQTGKHPQMIGIAIGAITDPYFPAPVRSVWEDSKHHWVTLPEAIQHFPQGRR